ncbi:serine/threonine/tyrosine-interacting protein B-like [Mya arenaria]|uniref:serine/threonine/tyrosine-interacting protein B-like n=1 Tax=Mya arenaria TaxID=6604 RepID=UPI0022E2ED8F|nr:serine/threonine/tyrosine-interacting protein B-like [Mya arenaria]
MEHSTVDPKAIRNIDGVDWSYGMRREMQEIVPGLFLGPYAAAMKSKKCDLQNRGITHIVCIRQNIEANFIRANFPDTFKYLILDIADTFTENIIRFMSQFQQFVDGCLKEGGKVLIHGNGGISRSASLVVAYLMEKLSLSFKDALMFVQRRRFCINPNEAFFQQLTEYEALCNARRSVLSGGTLPSGSRKRKFPSDPDDNISDTAMT